MASKPVPEYTELESVYGFEGSPEAALRYQRLAAAFEEKFGAPPDFFARAPGRVNLIGEHIDYEGYGVLPMAIRNDTVVAIRCAGDKLCVANLEADKFPAFEFSTDPSQPVDTANHTWANYFLSAYKGVFDHLASKAVQGPVPVGLQVMVHGNVPLGSGLSSSAAIVCSSAIAVLAAHGIQLTRGEVADFTCAAERYVGVTSGGMDQAISVLGMPGLAMLVEFNPVRAADVVLPEGAVFVIGNSLTVSKKQETADKRYNLRVVECRLAAAVLALGLGAPAAEAAAVRTLQEVEGLAAGRHGPGLAGKVAAVEALLHEGPYSQEELESLLSTPLEVLFKDSPSALRVLRVVKDDGYKLRQRALHVYTEASRVHEFKAAAESNVGTLEDKLAALGGLMDASHTSCSQLYECSCPELEELVGCAKAAGALGARLTGAGWGGCTVSLVRQEELAGFLDALRQRFYAQRVADGLVAQQQLGDCLFASKPSSGAAVLKLQLAGQGGAGAAKQLEVAEVTA